jgi:hypothetical protein
MTNHNYKEVMVSCSKGTTDYDFAGSKTSGKVLAEAGTVQCQGGGARVFCFSCVNKWKYKR